jgi:hypothetical protein
VGSRDRGHRGRSRCGRLRPLDRAHYCSRWLCWRRSSLGWRSASTFGAPAAQPAVNGISGAAKPHSRASNVYDSRRASGTPMGSRPLGPRRGPSPTKGLCPLETRQKRRRWSGWAGGGRYPWRPPSETWPWLIQPPQLRPKGGLLECVAEPSSLLAAGPVVEAKSKCASFPRLRGGVQFRGKRKSLRCLCLFCLICSC